MGLGELLRRKFLHFRLYDSLRRIPGLSAGYFDPRSGEVLASHYLAAGSVLVLILIYVFAATIFDPSDPTVDSVPPVAVLLYLAALLTSVLAGMAYFFDRFRFPLLIGLLLLTLIAGLRTGSYHAFEVQEREAALQRTTVVESIGTSAEPVIVVCAAGGGIQASAWAARVLGELDAGVTDFAQRLRLISSVSGGSTGSMFYLEKRRRCIGEDFRPLTAEERKQVLEASMSSSLGAVGLALVFKDLRRPLGLFVDRENDRASALEAVWRRSLGEEPVDSRLGDWAALTKQRKLPAICFNATLAGSSAGPRAGHRMLFSSVNFDPVANRRALGEEADASAGQKGWAKVADEDFFRVYGESSDIDVVSAARLSATFPYVSPIARADNRNENLDDGALSLGMADGGYFDNQGFTTAMQWLTFLLDADKKNKVTRKVALVLIEPFPSGEGNSSESSLAAWRDAAIGPIELMLAARSGTQNDRLQLELDLLGRLFDGGSEAGAGRLAVFRFGPQPAKQGPPLSWHLSSEEKEHLRGPAWGQAETGANARQLDALKKHIK